MPAAAPADGRFPLVMQFHGANGHRRDRAYLCTHLASHGYVVASPDFPGDTTGDLVRDIDDRSGARTASLTIDELADLRPRDAAFALNRVLAGAEPAVEALVDPTRLGTCGHSFGGWTTLALNSVDRRPQASFATAPLWGTHSSIPQVGRVQPRLFFHETNRKMYLSGDFPDPEIDATALGEAMLPFAELCTEARAHDTVRALCLAHMDAHLKGDAYATAFLDGDLTDVFAARSIGLEVVRG